MGIGDFIGKAVTNTGVFTAGMTPLGDGNFVRANGDVVNKSGVVMYAYDPNKKAYQNAQGHTVDHFGRRLTGVGGPDLTSILPGGGGSGSGADHFFDINPLDQQAFDAKGKQQSWQNDFDMTQFNYQKAIDQKNQAIRLGDQEMAKQAQASADYWAGKKLEVEQAMNAQDNQTSIATHQIDAGAQIQSANIAADSARFAAKTRLQEGLANAHNDAQRNQIMLVHEKEVAAIAKMEDDTKRAIAGRESQIQAFGAETTRAAQMGDLALKNNQFLMDSATNPRSLFGLYFMQRGLTPDWETVKAGGQVGQGEGLKVYDPMKAYKPGVMMPTDFGINAGGAYGGVGSAAGGASLESNPYMGMGLVPEQGGGGGSGTGSGSGSGFSGGGFTEPNFSSVASGAPPQIQQDINKAGLQGGVPLAGLKPGMNLSTVGGDTLGSDFTRPAYYDEAKTQAVGKGDSLSSGMQVWIDNTMPKMAQGGYTTESQFMTGDSTNPNNPSAGGAKPEIINNPTNAPISVTPNPNNVLDYGRDRNTQRDSRPNQQERGESASGFGGGWGRMSARPQGSGLDYPRLQGVSAPTGGGLSYMPPQDGGYRLNRPMQPVAQPQFMPPQDDGYKLGGNSGFGNNNLDFPMNNPGFQGGPLPSQYMPPQGGGYQFDHGPSMPTDRPVEEAYRRQQEQPQFMPPQGGGYQLDRNITQSTAYDNRWQNGSDGSTWSNGQPDPWNMAEYGMNVNRLDYGNANYAREAANQNPNYNAYVDSIRGRMPTRYAYGTGMPRYALGTGEDNSQQYADMGQGSLWLGSSDNNHLSGMELPDAMRGLNNYKVPITPSLAAAATGRIAPTLNTSSAWQKWGGGTLPSLQGFGGMTTGEVENFKGYAGVVGMPWADIVDYLGKPTQNLGTARQSQGLF